MTIDEIKELIRVVHETGIAELEVQRGDNRVRIRSAAPLAQDHVTTPAAAIAGASAPLDGGGSGLGIEGSPASFAGRRRAG